MRNPLDALPRLGRFLFSLAIFGVGIETLVCAQRSEAALGPGYDGIPVIPWVPAIPWLAFLTGAIWITSGVGLLFRRTARMSAITLGTLLFFCALVIVTPRYAVKPGSMSLRTVVFEPLSIACLAWLLPWVGIPAWLARLSRYLLALSLIVFGVDHFLALAPIGALLPAWIPWHVFWVAFFGAVFIASGVSIALNWLDRPGAAGVGLMFAIWVLTLHLPRVLGLYGIPGAPRNPNEWSSLLIALALWGGLWTRVPSPGRSSRSSR